MTISEHFEKNRIYTIFPDVLKLEKNTIFPQPKETQNKYWRCSNQFIVYIKICAGRFIKLLFEWQVLLFTGNKLLSSFPKRKKYTPRYYKWEDDFELSWKIYQLQFKTKCCIICWCSTLTNYISSNASTIYYLERK